MAKFYYEKWSISKLWTGTKFSLISSTPIAKGITITGYSKYYLDRRTGIFFADEKDLIDITVGDESASENRVFSIISGGKTVVRSEIFKKPDDEYTELKYNSYITFDKYEKDNYLETIISEEGIFPDDGILGNYWYIKGARMGINIFPKIDGKVKHIEHGKVNIGGELKDILGVWTKIDGQLKEV